MASASSMTSGAGTSLSICRRHILHTPKKFQTKVFSVMYLHKFKMIFTASSKFWPGVKKMHLNFGTCPHRQEADPNSNWGRYPRTKGLGKSGSLNGVFSQFMNLGHPSWHFYSRDEVPSNWHLSLPWLAAPASVPCSTVQQTGIIFQFLGHSVQTHGSRT